MSSRVITLNDSVSVETTVASCTEIPYEKASGGQLYIPAGSGLTSLTWHAAENDGATYLPAHNEAGSAVTQVVAAEKSYPIPVALFGCAALKVVGNTSGTIKVVTKS